jgi:acetyltransferase-like isoleucine patch superfamily enzyme
MINKIRKAFRLDAEPLPLAVSRLTTRTGRKVASAVLARQLKAPRGFFGPRSQIRGARAVSFGADFSCGSDTWIEAVTTYGDDSFQPAIRIGTRVALSNRVHISAIERIEIGDETLIGSGVFVADHNHGDYSGTVQSSPAEAPAVRRLGGGGPVVVGPRVWIGDNAVLIGPLTIGAGAVIGANAVVTKDVAPGAIVGGIPARVLKRWHDAGGWVR